MLQLGLLWLAWMFIVCRRRRRQPKLQLLRLTVHPRPPCCREAVEKSLKYLGLDYIDLYYLHRKVSECSEAKKQSGSTGRTWGGGGWHECIDLYTCTAA